MRLRQSPQAPLFIVIGSVKHMSQGTPISSDFLETPPSPGRVAVAIAGYPYSPRAAVQDLIDNSVEAGADGVVVMMSVEDKQLVSIAIADKKSRCACHI